jgi:predicted neuraminidase
MIAWLGIVFGAALGMAAQPVFESELIFPLEHWHNHSSSIVELPNGDLLVCWYNGSGERTADDVKIEAARLPRGARQWGKRYVLADTPDFPDTNPVMFADSRQRLWLIWPVILANRWETALLKMRISAGGWRSDPPHWDWADNILFIPRNFEAKVKQTLEPLVKAGGQGRAFEEMKRAYQAAGDKYFSRLGWMPRTHPLELPSGRVLAPLYSDGYNFSLIAITDDGGRTWSTSEPLVSEGGVQPALVRRRDGVIAAYMRDNGPPPKRVQYAESKDDGVTWSAVKDTDIPNPGSSVEVIALRDGSWLMVANDTERGRHSLVAMLSDDEGRTWKWRRHIELDQREQGAGSFHYPSAIQSRDGFIHLTYSYFLNHLPPTAPRKSIKHARFNVDWIKRGD